MSSTPEPTTFRRSRFRTSIVAGLLAVASGPMLASAVVAADTDGRPIGADVSTDPTALTREWLARRRLHDVVADMPVGWAATEVMRREANEPIGTAADRERWRQIAEQLPAGWGATTALSDAASWPPT